MFIVEIKEVSPVNGAHKKRGSLVIEVEDRGSARGTDYKVQMFPATKKSVISHMEQGSKPIRRSYVKGHNKGEPIQSLVLKALKALRYEI